MPSDTARVLPLSSSDDERVTLGFGTIMSGRWPAVTYSSVQIGLDPGDADTPYPRSPAILDIWSPRKSWEPDVVLRINLGGGRLSHVGFTREGFVEWVSALDKLRDRVRTGV